MAKTLWEERGLTMGQSVLIDVVSENWARRPRALLIGEVVERLKEQGEPGLPIAKIRRELEFARRLRRKCGREALRHVQRCSGCDECQPRTPGAVREAVK